MEKTKSFDAVHMVRQIRDAYYEQTKQMTKEERLAFYKEKGEQAQTDMERLAKQISADNIEEAV